MRVARDASALRPALWCPTSAAASSQRMLRCFCGYSLQLRPSNERPVRFLFIPPHLPANRSKMVGLGHLH